MALSGMPISSNGGKPLRNSLLAHPSFTTNQKNSRVDIPLEVSIFSPSSVSSTTSLLIKYRKEKAGIIQKGRNVLLAALKFLTPHAQQGFHSLMMPFTGLITKPDWPAPIDRSSLCHCRGRYAGRVW